LHRIGDGWGRLRTVGDGWGRLGTVGDGWGRLGTVGDGWGRLGTGTVGGGRRSETGTGTEEKGTRPESEFLLYYTGTKSSKTGQNFIFQKSVKLYLVPATNLKNKILRFVASTKYGGIPVLHLA
jgi:hypothetical protein